MGGLRQAYAKSAGIVSSTVSYDQPLHVMSSFTFSVRLWGVSLFRLVWELFKICFSGSTPPDDKFLQRIYAKPSRPAVVPILIV